MPSHTFTRLGYWQDSIDTNTASGAAARRDGVVAEELHTMDYRIYAYLQTAQDRRARRMLEALPELAARFDPDALGSVAPGSAGVFALAAIPARYALERGAWAEQTEIQRRSASAWLAFAERREADALAEMRAAAVLEDGTEKSAVTPGPLAPARELLGEMLLELKDPAQARKEFEATLKKEPNRFRAVYGAAHAASLTGDRAAARRYYDQLLRICKRADRPGRPALAEARQAPRFP